MFKVIKTWYDYQFFFSSSSSTFILLQLLIELFFDLKVFVGRIFVAVYLHVGYVSFLGCCRLIDFYESLNKRKERKLRKEI